MDDSYGIDVEGPIPLDEDDVVVPEVSFHLNGEDFVRLQQVVDPLDTSEDYGIDLYQQTLEFTRSLPH